MSIEKLSAISKKKKKLVIGLMSGTSLDGIDAALVEIKNQGVKTKVRQIEFISFPFPYGFKEFAIRNSETGKGTVTEICQLNFLIARIYYDAIKALCKKAKITLSDIDLIGSHGQTIHHLPKEEKLFGFSTSSTLQVGDPSVLAKLTGITTIGDFRVADVALGGQGAPLVPYFDYLMFRSSKNIALLNIGGISNITVLKKNCDADDVVAFDTGPGNMLIDTLTKKYFAKNYDEEGEIALSGSVENTLLEKLMLKDEFFSSMPPKSTGREYYGKTFLRKISKDLNKYSYKNQIATITDFTAFCVFYNYKMFIQHKSPIDELLLSGGGAYNKAIVKSLKKYFGNSVSIKKIKEEYFTSDAKEAVCFAVLANETISGNCANLPSVTGAIKKTILGKICLP